MEALGASSVPSFHIRTTLNKTKLRKPMFLNFHFNQIPSLTFSLVHRKQSKSKVFNTISSTVSTEPTNPPEPVFETHGQGEKFDWYSHWCPWGRLQCAYHGWCFNGSGNCQFIPQAPPNGPK
ncbi:protochlorophyllide-dependent translocon component 52, partial [Quercus suber]